MNRWKVICSGFARMLVNLLNTLLYDLDDFKISFIKGNDVYMYVEVWFKGMIFVYDPIDTINDFFNAKKNLLIEEIKIENMEDPI